MHVVDETTPDASTTHRVHVDGADIRYRAWGRKGGAGLVLVHGSSAHLHWWDRVAPALARQRRVVALDLSGHGDSDHRPSSRYSLDLWAREVLAVAQHDGMNQLPVVVGHSMGGVVALAAASLYPAQVAAAVAIDSLVRQWSDEERDARHHRVRRRSPTRSSEVELIRRFAQAPGRAGLDAAEVARIARLSITHTGGLWTWKSDSDLYRMRDFPAFSPILAPSSSPVALVVLEKGLMTEAMIDTVRQGVSSEPRVVRLAGAGHDVMLEDPLALAGCLGGLFLTWPPARSPATTPTTDHRAGS